MLFCGESLRRFYVPLGWEPIDTARIVSGDRTAPVAYDALVMMRFISEKGRAARTAFETNEVYVGERTW
jgi:hypothetical protein